MFCAFDLQSQRSLFFAPEEIAQPLGVIRTLYEEMFPGVDFSEYLKQREEMDAISYLFRVTAGLESMVLGEDQILGQVRDAFELSRTVGSTGKELNRVVQDAVTCAKKIKTKLRISERPLSVSYVGIRQLQETFGIAGKKHWLWEADIRQHWLCVICMNTGPLM